jgi:hypothetical protein
MPWPWGCCTGCLCRQRGSALVRRSVSHILDIFTWAWYSFLSITLSQFIIFFKQSLFGFNAE